MINKNYIIPALAVVCIIALVLFGPIYQDQQYHHFADERPSFSIPNFLNVVTNLPFLFVGITGLLLINKAGDKVLKVIFRLLFIGFLFLTFGSGYYHLRPNDQSLVYDRIPIVVIIMSFSAFIVYDFVDRKKGLIGLIIFNLIGLGSVFYWALGDAEGKGDLRLYAMVQFFPVIAIPAIIFLHKSTYNLRLKIVLIFLFFALAKLSEMLDFQIFHLLNSVVSGHSLKHLFMALAGYEIISLANYRIKVNNFSSTAP